MLNITIETGKDPRSFNDKMICQIIYNGKVLEYEMNVTIEQEESLVKRIQDMFIVG